MTTKMKPAQRILELPPYVFKRIDDKKRELAAAGTKLLNFGIGDPDLPTPDFVVEAMNRAMRDNANQKYPAYEGDIRFREAVARYMHDRFGVQADPRTEVMALIGSKEGLAHFAWAFIDENDVALVPDPAYPVYKTTTEFAGGEAHILPLLAKNGFLPDLSRVPDAIARRAKTLYINYPNNPTGAVASESDLAAIVEWARKHEVIIVSDAAYAELTYDPRDRRSILSIPGAKDVAIEFHSFSKIFNMTGWRIGFAVGNPALIAGLLKLKTNVDSGVFDAIQLACVSGLARVDAHLERLQETYRKRRDTMVTILDECGIRYQQPRGAFYVWAHCPDGITSEGFTMKLMEETGIVTTPGTGFGPHGEGYVRFALTQSVETIEAIRPRLEKFRKSMTA
ncbi:MAG TPA: LL-diaminopimelate aminotransferase [Candidatus Ozemobacteraceae bacterium]|nr:LL-diaminopimelate aminotransferase [Candidatus Ozemobacteraceae bacterium]